MKRESFRLICLICLLCANSVFAQYNSEIEYWQKQLQKALEERDKPVGVELDGLTIPVELSATVITKQTAKLAEMTKQGYKKPLDFADLASKKLDGEFVALPLVTETYILDMGGSTTEEEFTQFALPVGSKPLKPNSPKFLLLSKLADDFDGLKFDINNPKDRKQFKLNLLRLINPRAKAVLEELAAAYKKTFGRPLRVTSGVRSIEYQVMLNKSNANSFKVSSADAFPPHTSGCAFDLGYKNMTAEEQNFLMTKIAEMEKNGIVDGLREGGVNAAFHIFVYPDGKPPVIKKN